MGNTPNKVDYSKLSQEELAVLAAKQAEEISDLTAANQTLKDDVKTLKGEKSSLKKENDLLLELNTELQASAEASANGPVLPEVKVGDKIYLIAIPRFTHNGFKRTAEDLKRDPALVKELVKIESGVLKLKG